MPRRLFRLALVLILAPLAAHAAPPVLTVTYRAGAFHPAQLEVPPGRQVQLHIHNEGVIPIEFESYDLSREVVVPGRTTVRIYVGPLTPGRYRFFNDFDRQVKGQVVVRKASGG